MRLVPSLVKIGEGEVTNTKYAISDPKIWVFSATSVNHWSDSVENSAAALSSDLPSIRQVLSKLTKRRYV